MWRRKKNVENPKLSTKENIKKKKKKKCLKLIVESVDFSLIIYVDKKLFPRFFCPL